MRCAVSAPTGVRGCAGQQLTCARQRCAERSERSRFQFACWLAPSPTIAAIAKSSPTYSGDPALRSETPFGRFVPAAVSQEALTVVVGLDRSYVGGIEPGEHDLASMLSLHIANEPSELLKRASV